MVTIEDITDDILQNINPLSDEDMRKLVEETSNAHIQCKDPIMIRIDESSKAKLSTTDGIK